MARILFAGADVRVAPESLEAAWDDTRRERYLLRPTVARPLSVDRAVWPACPTADGDRSPAVLPWVSVETVLQRAGEARRKEQLRVVTVVIGLVVETSNDEALAASRGIDAEMVADPRWRPLGFDIADGTDISALSNCADEAHEANALRNVWAPRLNDHGLFDELHDALAFRTLTDERVREHAPFAVYGMWLVGEALEPGRSVGE